MKSPRLSTSRLVYLIAVSLVLVFGSALVAKATMFGGDENAEEGGAAPEISDTDGDGGAVEIDQARVEAGLAIFKESGCRGCHGWAANGVREGPNPQGPSLRASMLPEDAIRLAVSCGRPGSEMPYFWREAYRRDSVECYGMTANQLGDLMPIRGGIRYNAEAIDDLVYFLEHYVKGRGEITSDECEFYFGEGNPRCPAYPNDPG